MIDEITLQNIKREAIKIDWDKSFGGRSKGNKHLERIVSIAKHIARKEGADLSIVEAGSWLHDIALPTGDDKNYQTNIKITLDLLRPLGVAKKDARLVAECVATHEGVISPKTIEAKVVHDADVLEKIGILGLIRHTWKMTNFKEINPSNIRDRDIEAITRHIDWRIGQLQTESSKKFLKYLNIKLSFSECKRLVLKISSLAADGYISEEIADLIIKNLNTSQAKALEKQLHINLLTLNQADAILDSRSEP